MTKYIFVTGGVVSGLGKGITAASLGRRLKADEVICGALGEHVLSQYVEGKEKEWDAYRTHVSAWEIDRYLVMY